MRPDPRRIPCLSSVTESAGNPNTMNSGAGTDADDADQASRLLLDPPPPSRSSCRTGWCGGSRCRWTSPSRPPPLASTSSTSTSATSSRPPSSATRPSSSSGAPGGSLDGCDHYHESDVFIWFHRNLELVTARCVVLLCLVAVNLLCRLNVVQRHCHRNCHGCAAPDPSTDYVDPHGSVSRLHSAVLCALASPGVG